MDFLSPLASLAFRQLTSRGSPYERGRKTGAGEGQQEGERKRAEADAPALSES
ncbi:hypothetical protein HMPREF0620_0968 [Parascardovia denticolens DSM 10105 = JCM 12538]|uniref:Uncharacterized protein n=1 Tax=Parascardovia denticolens DSM 10105 = JCM 12538 TaxID=864564 RepID=E6JZ73_PARDN|nr:hypothetical protein HMPREF0620_0968 [Parascardovia denticolens DSM 10105 = JCM 12538]